MRQTWNDFVAWQRALKIIIIIINKVLIKVTLNKVIAGALYIVICGWNAVKVQSWQLRPIRGHLTAGVWTLNIFNTKRWTFGSSCAMKNTQFLMNLMACLTRPASTVKSHDWKERTPDSSSVRVILTRYVTLRHVTLAMTTRSLIERSLKPRSVKQRTTTCTLHTPPQTARKHEQNAAILSFT